METRLLYLEDPDTLEFETEVIGKITLPGGLCGAILQSTFFYPGGGGQECDYGIIGGVRVLDVHKDTTDEGRVIHVLEKDIPCGKTTGRIDSMRRRGHMQHHTAQHILSHCFLAELGLETVSVKISADAPSTLDINADALAEDSLVRIETSANAIVFENREVKTFFVTAAEAAQMALRRQPAVGENIRIVEIEGLDMTPCGGTHCRATGNIGMIKLLRTERVNSGKMRVHFAVGWQALEVMREYSRAMKELNALFSSPVAGIVAAVQRQGEQLREVQEALKGAQETLIPLEARQLAETGTQITGRRVVFSQYDNRSAGEMRLLGGALAEINGIVAVLLNIDGQKFSLVVSCADDSGIQAGQLLRYLLEPFNGRGGGDRRLAQGGGIIGPDSTVDPGKILSERLVTFGSLTSREGDAGDEPH